LLPLRNTQILSPLLNQDKKLQLKAQSIFTKLNDMDMGQEMSFDDLKKKKIWMKKITC
jgi:hypothetical protein